MNAHFLEITIKAIVAGITLFILVRYIFFLKLEGFWNFVFPSKNRAVEPTSEGESKPEAKQEAAVSEPVTATVAKPPTVESTPKLKPEVKAEGDGIVGESKTVYIANPVSLKPTPHRSEDLECETLPESEAEPSADEVEDSLDAENNTNVSELEPDEYYMESTVGDIDNAEFPTGATFEQMANAYEVARGMEVDDDKIEEAVDTFYAIRGNNFCDFIVAQSERIFALGQILEEHVENDGTLIKHLKNRKLSPEVVNFDISRYE